LTHPIRRCEANNVAGGAINQNLKRRITTGDTEITEEKTVFSLCVPSVVKKLLILG